MMVERLNYQKYEQIELLFRQTFTGQILTAHLRQPAENGVACHLAKTLLSSVCDVTMPFHTRLFLIPEAFMYALVH